MGNWDSLVTPNQPRRTNNAKQMGNAFENLFAIAAAQSGVACTRVPDGCRTVGRNRLIRVKSPFDWCLSFRGRSAFIDTKTMATKRFSHSLIDLHQVNELLAHEEKGCIAGYVIQLRQTGVVLFVKASVLLKRHFMGEGSISAEDSDVQIIGSMLHLDLGKLFCS